MTEVWIKWCKGLAAKPRVIQLAQRFGLSRFDIAGRLMTVWEWLDSNSLDGCRVANITNRYQVAMLIDDIAQLSGFAEAMIDVGWLAVDDDGMMFPRADEHNGKTAKKRALTSKNMNTYRRSRYQNVIESDIQSDRQTDIQNDHQSKSKSNTNTSAAVASEGERVPAAPAENADDPKSSKASNRQPDPIWDEVARQWFGGTVADPDRPRVGRIVAALKAHNASPTDIARVRAAYRAKWPSAADTPEAVVKHWAAFAGGTQTVRDAALADQQAAARAAQRAADERQAEDARRAVQTTLESLDPPTLAALHADACAAMRSPAVGQWLAAGPEGWRTLGGLAAAMFRAHRQKQEATR